MTPVGCRTFTTAGIFQLGLGFAADLTGTLKLAGRKISRRIGTRFVDHIGQYIGAIGRQTLTGDRMFPQTGDKLFIGGLELIGIRRRSCCGAGIVNHDHFHTLGAHDGAHTAAAGMPGGPLFHIRESNRCDRHLHFAGRADGDAVDFFTVFGFHLVDQIIVAEHA